MGIWQRKSKKAKEGPNTVAPVKIDFTQPGIVFVGLLAYFSLIQVLSPRISGNDSYFHIKYAWLIWHEGAIWNFPWLQGTLFREHWVDHQFLYHLLLIPFTWIGNLYLAAKVAGIFWSATALFAVYAVIRRMNEPASAWYRLAWIWPLIMVASSPSMLYRLSQTRIQAVSLLLMMVAVIIMEKERYKMLLPLGFGFAWLYNGSVILIPLTLLFGLSCLIIEKRWVWQPVAWATAGLGLGFLLNPYFPQNLDFLVRHIYEFAGNRTGLPMAFEWQDYTSWFLFQSTQGAWLVLLVGILVLGFSERRMTRRNLFWLLASTMMQLLFFKARRFVEYWPLFAVVFTASTLCDTQDQWEPLLSRNRPNGQPVLTPLVREAVFTGFVTGLGIIAGFHALKTAQEIHFNAPPDRFVSASAWLKAHTPKGTIVFNAQWDTFPDLFFHNHHNLWVAGLNPNFTYFLDPRLWRVYDGVSKGMVMDTARYLQRDFGARYALTLKDQAGLVKLADVADNGLNLVWEDGTTAIYQVHPSDHRVQLEGELYPYKIAMADGQVKCQAEEQSECQNYGDPSNRGFLACRITGKIARIAWRVELPRAGTWVVEGRFLKTRDGGTAAVLVNGKTLGAPIDLFDGRKQVGSSLTLGEQDLSAGPLEVEIVYTFPAGRAKKVFGLDELTFTRSGGSPFVKVLEFESPETYRVSD